MKKYFLSELDLELSDLKAGYNQGVKDAEEFFRNKLEDLSATCFEPGLTYWQQKRK